jgi:hypothetical protein
MTFANLKKDKSMREGLLQTQRRINPSKDFCKLKGGQMHDKMTFAN